MIRMVPLYLTGGTALRAPSGTLDAPLGYCGIQDCPRLYVKCLFGWRQSPGMGVGAGAGL